MNVFRENCCTCINSRPPMCELYNEPTYADMRGEEDDKM